MIILGRMVLVGDAAGLFLLLSMEMLAPISIKGRQPKLHYYFSYYSPTNNNNNHNSTPNTQLYHDQKHNFLGGQSYLRYTLHGHT